jgi:hypothetical protein
MVPFRLTKLIKQLRNLATRIRVVYAVGRPDFDLAEWLLARTRPVAATKILVSSEEPLQHDANGLSLLVVEN